MILLAHRKKLPGLYAAHIKHEYKDKIFELYLIRRSCCGDKKVKQKTIAKIPSFSIITKPGPAQKKTLDLIGLDIMAKNSSRQNKLINPSN